MKNVFCLWMFMLMITEVTAQPVASRLASAFSLFENDPQLKNAIASIYVQDASTGRVVFEKAGYIGLVPASTQKIITAATAYDLLGKDFRYKTTFGYAGSQQNGTLNGGLWLQPSGDPTLGSWRWNTSAENTVMARLLRALRQDGITTVNRFFVADKGWEGETIPGGWIWDDIGNYYGAGAGAFNWRENQYDLLLKSGSRVGDPVVVVGTKPALYEQKFVSHVTAAPRGTGDNSYIYFSRSGSPLVVRGTIPVNEERFVIAGAMPDPLGQFVATLCDSLQKSAGAPVQTPVVSLGQQSLPAGFKTLHTETSPPLDSIIYWFLRRSINLYGEALAKTMALQQGKTALATKGTEVIRQHWKEKMIGIDATELNMHDGSGLSPQNRVTTHAQVTVLQYAKKQPWFAGYYAAFPEFNGMKLKSGTIGGAKGFCGYHTSKEGRPYIVSFLVNNYNGSSSSLVQKMYKVLDVLK